MGFEIGEVRVRRPRLQCRMLLRTLAARRQGLFRHLMPAFALALLIAVSLSPENARGDGAQRMVVLLNFGATSASVDMGAQSRIAVPVPLRVRLSTALDRDESVAATITLRPEEGLILGRPQPDRCRRTIRS